MNEYIVTIDSMSEQYVYDVDADDVDEACAMGEYLASIDGLDLTRWHESVAVLA
jgi:hypothetical protein